MVFDVIRTSIANITADAIVLPANTGLREGPGASAAIFEAAGRKQLTQACKKLGNCEIGNAVPTLAFNLNAKYIIHAVVPKWIDGKHSEYDLLSSAYLAAMNIADVMGCQSIAFPLLASGNNGFDLELAFEISEKSIELFESASLKKVFLVVYTDNVAAMLKEKGYTILDIPNDMRKLELKEAHKAKAKELAEEGKEIAHKFLEEQITKALDYLKDEKNREKVIKFGIEVAKIVFRS